MTAISQPAPNPAALQALRTNLHETIQEWSMELAFIQDEMQFLERIIYQASLGSRENKHEQLIQKLRLLNREYIVPICLSLKEGLPLKKSPSLKEKPPASTNFKKMRQRMNLFSKEYKQLKKAIFQKVEDISSVEIW